MVISRYLVTDARVTPKQREVAASDLSQRKSHPKPPSKKRQSVRVVLLVTPRCEYNRNVAV